jgi:hypothetical protein
VSDEVGTKSWLQTLPGFLTASAAVLTALTAFVAAISGFFPKLSSPAVQDCISPYVWREAYRDDRVCVTTDTHVRTLQDNELAASRRNLDGGAWGADTCKSGFVFRDAFPGDRVCVDPDSRYQAQVDNQQAPLRVRR